MWITIAIGWCWHQVEALGAWRQSSVATSSATRFVIASSVITIACASSTRVMELSRCRRDALWKRSAFVIRCVLDVFVNPSVNCICIKNVRIWVVKYQIFSTNFWSLKKLIINSFFGWVPTRSLFFVKGSFFRTPYFSQYIFRTPNKMEKI